jgi:hypothetical protein
MRRASGLILAAMLAIGLAGCSGAAGGGYATGSAGGTPAAPVPTAQVVWSTQLSSKAYHSWQKAPGFDTPRPSHSPHGKTVMVYVDANIAKTLAGPSASSWSVGSEIVKDAFDDAGALVEVTYMQRLGQGWFYASYDPSGTVVKQGVEVPSCAGCHRSGSDEVKSFKLPG